MKSSNNFELIIFIGCFLLAAAFLLICTTSSPLYPTNSWVDTNASLTVGRGLIQQRVLYKDLFEQRGPILYFLYGFAALISSRSFLGVLIFQILSYAIFLFFSYKLLSLYIDGKQALLGLPLISFIILNSNAFWTGGSPEELALPGLMAGLYFLMKFVINYSNFHGFHQANFISGLAFGFVFWMKYTLVALWMGWFVISVAILVNQQKWKYLKSLVITFCAGFLISTLPVLIYFMYTNATYNLIETYFINNLTSYSTNYGLTRQIEFIVSNLFDAMRRNFLALPISFIGATLFIFRRKKQSTRIERWTPILLLIAMTISIYIGGKSYRYYPLILFIFVNFSLITILEILTKKGWISWLQTKNVPLLVTGFTVFLVLISYFLQGRAAFSKVKQEDLVQYQFAQIINQYPSATMLNFGYLDNGFYLAADIIPNVKVFFYPNISPDRNPYFLEEQTRYIKEKLVDFVIIREVDFVNINTDILLNDDYELVSQGQQSNRTYSLYKRTDLHNK
jgi:hypothetical protein